MLDCIQQTVNNESTSSTVLVRYLEIIDEKMHLRVVYSSLNFHHCQCDARF